MTTIIRRKGLGMSSAKGIAEFSKTGINWVRSDKVLPPDDLYIRWGCTTNVPTKNVLNTANAIHQVNDKRAFRMTLDDDELCPKTWDKLGKWAQYVDPLMFIEEEGHLPLKEPYIVRRATHAQGRNLHTCTDTGEVAKWCQHYGEGNYYISEFIDKVAEYRVAVVQGRAVWVAQKTPGNPNDVAWNVAKGGRFDNVRWDAWPLKAVRVAIEAFNLTTLDFGGVDVMVDADGEAYILEINSAPSLTSPYRQLCFAKAFDYIITNNKERIPLIDERGGYLKFIHPAVEPKAKI